MTDVDWKGHWDGYVNETLTAESDLLRAITVIRAIASDPRNYVREIDGESILDKLGYPPQSDGERGETAEPLLPWVRARLLPPGARTPIQLTYEVRVLPRPGSELPLRLGDPLQIPTLHTVRVLSVDIDLLAPSTAPVTPEAVQAGAPQLYAMVRPIVEKFFPLHENVGASIMAHDPVPRGMAGGDTIHMRTAVLMRFSAADNDVTNAQNARRKVQLYGPNGKPL